MFLVERSYLWWLGSQFLMFKINFLVKQFKNAGHEIYTINCMLCSRYPHSPNSSHQGQAPMDSGWSRGGHYPGRGGFPSMPDRMRNQEEESRYEN